MVDHPSFGALPEDKLTEDSMTRESVEAVWDTLNASQTNLLNRSYYNSKLPFVFNYFSMNFDVSHTGTAQSDHGTHVAGIVAANQVEGVDVIGVVPDAQLVIMQVFTNTGGAEWDTVMAALEDCIRLDVDAANLSLVPPPALPSRRTMSTGFWSCLPRRTLKWSLPPATTPTMRT